jgi:hypothetical protein
MMSSAAHESSPKPGGAFQPQRHEVGQHGERSAKKE